MRTGRKRHLVGILGAASLVVYSLHAHVEWRAADAHGNPTSALAMVQPVSGVPAPVALPGDGARPPRAALAAAARQLGPANLRPAAVAHDANQTATVVAQLTASAAPTNTSTSTITPSPTPTNTPTLSPTSTNTSTLSPTPTNTPTLSPTLTNTSTPTLTPTITTTGTPTATPLPVVTYYFAEGYTGQAATNGKATFTETLNILNPTTNVAPVTITYYPEGGGTPTVVNKTVSPQGVLRQSVNADVGPDKVVSASVASAQKIFVSRTITRVTAGGARLGSSTTAGATTTGTSFGFAEGYTGITFQEYLVVFNPSTSSASVTVQLAPQAGSATGAKSTTLTVPAQGRTTQSIRALYTSGSVPSVGMIVTSTQPVIAERVEYFGDGVGSGKFGSTVAGGISTTPAGSTFSLPYGTSGGSSAGTGGRINPLTDQEYITLLNPSTSGGSVRVTASFYDATGKTITSTTPISATVAPGTRQTILANAAVGTGAAGPFSVLLQGSGGNFIAEGAQYFGGSPNVGTHPGVVVPAVSTASTDGFLSDLSTQLPDGSSGVNRTVYLYNPGTSQITVSGTYLGGSTQGFGPSPTPTSTVTATQTPTQTQTPSTPVTITITPSATNTATNTVTATQTSTATPTSTGTATATSTATQTTTATAVPLATPVSYTVPAGGILAVPVSQPAGPVAAEFKSTGGPVVVFSIGITPDGLSATSDVDIPAY